VCVAATTNLQPGRDVVDSAHIHPMTNLQAGREVVHTVDAARVGAAVGAGVPEAWRVVGDAVQDGDDKRLKIGRT
jgi:hypothetical protein